MKRLLASQCSIPELLEHIASRLLHEPLQHDQYPQVRASVSALLHTWGKQIEQRAQPQEMQAIRGQEHVKRAVEVAAAGRHHLLLSGSSGSGKSMLARTLPTLLPKTAVPYPF